MSEPTGLSALTGGFNVDPLEDLLWGPFRESFGLTAEQWKRLTVVVTLHMALDRFLFLRVTLGLTMVAGDRRRGLEVLRSVDSREQRDGVVPQVSIVGERQEQLVLLPLGFAHVYDLRVGLRRAGLKPSAMIRLTSSSRRRDERPSLTTGI
jgi:hypothetical protein